MEQNDFLAAMQQETPKVEVSKEQETKEATAEQVLSVLSVVILVCGILATLICAFTITTIKTGYPSYDTEFNPAGFGITVSILVGSLISWSIMKVLANISITLKEIYKKLK
mgnify:CR=1 FL=1|jgi:uncharacterized integral membrane protein